jgi:hypothetical protein
MLAICDVWMLKFMTKAGWTVPVAQGVDRYQQHIGHRHLDVGPGTGYFIKKADPPRDTEITLLARTEPCFATWRSDSEGRTRPGPTPLIFFTSG